MDILCKAGKPNYVMTYLLVWWQEGSRGRFGGKGVACCLMRERHLRLLQVSKHIIPQYAGMEALSQAQKVKRNLESQYFGWHQPRCPYSAFLNLILFQRGPRPWHHIIS